MAGTNPIINQTYAGLSYFPIVLRGDNPVIQSWQLAPLPDPETQVYQNGTLLAVSSTPGELVIYDSTITDPHQTFAGIFFDNLSSPGAIASGFVDVAINDRPTTQWLYSTLIGANSGTTDVDALIAAGLLYSWEDQENNVSTTLVKIIRLGATS